MGYRSIKRRNTRKRRNTHKRGGSTPKLNTLKRADNFGSVPLECLRGKSAPGVLERRQEPSKNPLNPLIRKLRSEFNLKQANSTNPETRRIIRDILKKKKAKSDSITKSKKMLQIKLLIKHKKENPELAQKESEAAAQKISDKEEQIERKLALLKQKNEELNTKKAAAAAAAAANHP